MFHIMSYLYIFENILINIVILIPTLLHSSQLMCVLHLTCNVLVPQGVCGSEQRSLNKCIKYMLYMVKRKKSVCVCV